MLRPREGTDRNIEFMGVNPLEITHFKAGFLGIPPDFEEKKSLYKWRNEAT